MKVKLNTDNEGFVSQECPACKRRFKALLGQGSSEPIAFCPFCKYHETGCWWTPEQADYLALTVANPIIGESLKQLEKSVNGINRKSDFLKVSVKTRLDPVPPVPDEPEEPWAVMDFICCGEKIRHDGKTKSLF